MLKFSFDFPIWPECHKKLNTKPLANATRCTLEWIPGHIKVIQPLKDILLIMLPENCLPFTAGMWDRYIVNGVHSHARLLWQSSLICL